MPDANPQGRLGRVELHTHLEGSLTPARLVELCRRHDQPGLPLACLAPDGRSYRFEGFHGFLQLFRRATSVVRTPRDFHDLALDLGDQLAADQVGYAEVTVSYGVMLRRGIDPVAVQEALAEAAAEVAETGGPVMRWIPDAVRQWGPDEAARAAEAALTCGRRLGVVGFGLGGDEVAGPAAWFADLFAQVRAAGLGITIHAGEVPAMGEAALRSVRDAVEACGAMRLGHATAAAADPGLMAFLAARGVFIEACPRSNVQTGALPDLAAHPLRAFLDAGLGCCLNTDDRGFFGLDLEGEYAAAGAVLGLGPDEAAAMHAAARAAAFDDPGRGGSSALSG
ncbi:MAG TPA: adenosine deaminase [Candidatus Krumholzibacteria bacterium]|nr:adenosine deaminase [Candidatus Krumholzibacteria bacterium]